jgi:hypothetical protein
MFSIGTFLLFQMLAAPAISTSRPRPLTFPADDVTTDSEVTGDVKDIWLIGLFPLKGSWPGGLGQLPAVQLGLADVNADSRILPGYRLRMTMDDTEVSFYCISGAEKKKEGEK